MTQPSPADTLRTAEERVRMGDRRIDIALRGPIAEWLDSWTGIDLDESAAMPEDARHALAVARAILQEQP